jgi:hypothetical protein
MIRPMIVEHAAIISEQLLSPSINDRMKKVTPAHKKIKANEIRDIKLVFLLLFLAIYFSLPYYLFYNKL